MRLFRRKAASDETVERCPSCNEPLPEGATRCAMCGIALEPLRGPSRLEDSEPADLGIDAPTRKG